MELLKAFEAAKRRSIARATDGTVSYFPVPWIAEHADRARETFGEDFWPYGVEPNRRTLEAFLGYANEQGVTHRPLSVDELFAPETLDAFTV
jgi:4,5-dihydroxyphthalate decarboxylase